MRIFVKSGRVGWLDFLVPVLVAIIPAMLLTLVCLHLLAIHAVKLVLFLPDEVAR